MRRGKTARYAAVLEPVAKGAAPDIKDIAVAEKGGVIEITVTRSNGRDTITIDPSWKLKLASGGREVLSVDPTK
jgi:hypothetical protein